MAFYGNFSRRNSSSFQFDKTYPNRYEMDKAIRDGDDGVFIGRYVLVDYDRTANSNELPADEAPKTTIIPAYLIQDWNDNITFHTGASVLTPQIKFGEKADSNTVAKGDMILVIGKTVISEIKGVLSPLDLDTTGGEFDADILKEHEEFKQISPQLWECTGDKDGIATFELKNGHSATNDGQDSAYSNNYQIDAAHYNNPGRGWDSTVWQKTSMLDDNGQSIAKYVMVAELNSVVPTFDITVDAPTQTPIAPHFDAADISNVYYKLHLQPTWGVRIKPANPDYTLDTKKYPSDASGLVVVDSQIVNSNGLRQQALYKTAKVGSDGKEATDEYGNILWEVRPQAYDEESSYLDDSYKNDLAIFFNKEGFDPYRGSDALDTAKRQGASLDSISTNEGTDKAPVYKQLNDEIAIRPTGKSESNYVYHKDGKLEEKNQLPDTYEVSVMLPSIGQGMSELWDIVYGKNTVKDSNGRTLWHPVKGYFAEDKDGQRLRNANIAWDTTSGIRGITKKEDGILDYTKGNLNTVAGVINSAHDLMGMILRNFEIKEDPKYWDPTKIYYEDGAFYKKHKNYKYVAGTAEYVKIPRNNMVDIHDGNHYREDVGQLPKFENQQLRGSSEEKYINYIDSTSEDYIDGAIYGTLKEGQRQTVSAKGYEPDKYFYFDGETYIKDSAITPTNKNGVYYNVKEERVKDTEIYVPNRYWVKRPSANGDVIELAQETSLEAILGAGIKSTRDERAIEKGYVFYKNAEVVAKDNDAEENSYVSQEIGDKLTLESFPPEGRYNWNGDKTVLNILDAEGKVIDQVDATNVYSKAGKESGYSTKAYAVEEDDKYYSAWDIAEGGLTYKLNDKGEKIVERAYRLIPVKNDNTFSIKNAVNVDLIQFEPHKFFIEAGGNFTEETWEALKTTEGGYRRNTLEALPIGNAIRYYTLDIEKVDTFYDISSGYYFKDEQGDWRRETITRGSSQDNVEYYSAPNFTADENKKFYRPNYFYTYDEANKRYILDDSAEFRNGIDYYEKVGLFVMEDSADGQLKKGMSWNASAAIPNGIKVGQREEVWDKEELLGFGQSLNTMHGLLLQMSNKLLASDRLTRDQNTVQGSINKLNDIIAKFDILKPGEIVITDAYGRIHSAHLIDEQTGEVVNHGNNDRKALENKENWISVKVNDDKDSPTITITHNFTQQPDTTTSSDLNTNAKDSIVLYTPIVDSKGHVVGKNSETITLPYDFKTVAIGEVSNSVANLEQAAGNIVADNTQDTVSINSGNKWIKLNADAANDEFKIGHIVQSINTADNTATNLNTPEAGTINIPDFTYDEAGHIREKHSHVYTLPYNFKKITVGVQGNGVANQEYKSGSVEADAVFDEFTYTTGNKWISLSISEDAISVAHLVKAIDTAPSAATDLDAEGSRIGKVNIPDFTYDEAGHITAKKAHDYLLPHNFDKVVADGTEIKAQNSYDVLTITTSDKWLNTTVSGNTIDLTHKTSLNATTSVGDTANQTPKFGDTFKALSVIADETGHITSLNEHTITIPTPSLTKADAGNVLTGMTLNTTDGALTEVKTNVGTLTLNEYTQSSSISSVPSATDSINVAISKLSYIVDNSATPINSRISSALEELDLEAVGGEDKYIKLVKQEDGVVSAEAGNISDFAKASAVEELEQKLEDYVLKADYEALEAKYNKLVEALIAANVITEDDLKDSEELSSK